MSQSLPNQVNDFNGLSQAEVLVALYLSQSLPNQVNDFNKVAETVAAMKEGVAIPSKPGQRLQFPAMAGN